MRKRIFLYGGTVLSMLALFLVLSDRHVTDRVPPLESVLVRALVILALAYGVGSLIRVVRGRSARAGAG